MSVLTDVAAICGALTVVLIFVAAVARVRWVRWVWRHLVSKPLGDWLGAVVREGAKAFHEADVAPALRAIDMKADVAAQNAEKALAYAKAAAEYQGFPPGLDPTDRLPVPGARS